MALLSAELPAPLARYHTVVICKGNHIKPPTTRSPTQRFPLAKNLIKIPNYSFNKNSHILENGLVPLIKEGQLSHKNAFLRASGATLLRLGASLKRVNGAIKM